MKYFDFTMSSKEKRAVFLGFIIVICGYLSMPIALGFATVYILRDL